MPVLTANHLSKSYSQRSVLEDVSLALEPGERVGLIGSNGSGKSTLGKILAGEDQADGGTLARRRDLEVAYLPQEPQLDVTLTAYAEVERGLAHWRDAKTAYDAVSEKLSHPDGATPANLTAQSELATEIERLGGWDQSHRIHAMLEHLGIARPDQLIGQLSGGERRRVALARILVARPGLAILDEPTNHLDAETVGWLEEHLVNEYPGALLLITHDRYFLDRVVTRVFELDRGQLYTFEGNYARYLELKAERFEHDARVEANRMNILRREREWLSRGPAARTTKQKARINRAGDLEETVRDARRVVQSTKFEISGVSTGKRVLELRGATKRFGDRTLFENVDLLLTPGERLGVIGRNGSGKTTMVKAILGEEPLTAGTVTLGPNTRMMYFDQGRAGLEDDKTVFDSVHEGSDKVRLGDTFVNIHSYLERFLFDGAKQRQAVGSLSGGERARLALAKMLRGGANLVILDEPTNDLDLVTLSTLEDLLTGFDGCAIVITHDRYFLDRTATSILSFEGDGRVVQYAGNYSDSRVQRAAMDASRATTARQQLESSPPPAPVKSVKKTKGGLNMPEQKELLALPERIDYAEKKIAGIEAELNDPTLYSARGGEVAGLQSRLAAEQADRDGLMARWEELETRKGV